MVRLRPSCLKGEPVKYRNAFTDAYSLLKDEKDRGKILQLKLSLSMTVSLKHKPKSKKRREERHGL